MFWVEIPHLRGENLSFSGQGSCCPCFYVAAPVFWVVFGHPLTSVWPPIVRNFVYLIYSNVVTPKTILKSLNYDFDMCFYWTIRYTYRTQGILDWSPLLAKIVAFQKKGHFGEMKFGKWTCYESFNEMFVIMRCFKPMPSFGKIYDKGTRGLRNPAEGLNP